MEVRRSRRESAKNGPLELADVRPLTCNQRAPRIGSSNDLTRGDVLQSNYGEIGDVKRTRRVRDADIQWHRNRMVAHVGSIVTSPAEAVDHLMSRCVVQ